jgi:hypothetical protein
MRSVASGMRRWIRRGEASRVTLDLTLGGKATDGFDDALLRTCSRDRRVSMVSGSGAKERSSMMREANAF